MKIKSSQTLVEEAEKNIETLSAKQTKEIINSKNGLLIDIREKGELDKMGRVENSNHIPRGMLEFWLDPEGPYFKENKFDFKKKIILFCALGMRSALAAKSLMDMGFKNIAHVKGGFDVLKQGGFEIVAKEKK